MEREVIAPKGVLRAAINFGNVVLAHRGPTLPESSGVSVEIARELARRLNVPLQLIAFEGAGDVVKVAKDDDVFDVAFMAIDPCWKRGRSRLHRRLRADRRRYMVRNAAPLKSADEVDPAGALAT